jgi:tetratricopeptide (TPR) repeat protein
MKKSCVRKIGTALTLIVILAVAAQAQGRKPQPPELKQLMAASQIKDAAARIKEFERIKAAYPQSEYMSRIDEFIFRANVEMAESLDVVLELQRGMMARAEGPDRLGEPYMAAEQILEHPKLKTFDKARVTAAVLKYLDEAVKASEEAATYKGIPQDDQKFYKTYYVSGFKILLAQAYLNEGSVDKAQATLEAYKKEGGNPGAGYSYTLAEVYDRQGKAKEACENYLDAALDNHEGALDKAKALYVKVYGKPDGFEARLEAKQRMIPYEPEPFKPSAEWKGKAVLAEIFTGSECPPCVGADLGYDGLIDGYPVKYLAILEYHLPIPRPDPMINPASKKRQAYYGVNSTPSTFFDGEAKLGGGGGRSMSGDKYKQYETEVNSRVNAVPAVMLQATAVRTGDSVTVECGYDKVVPGVEYVVVLVQKEEKYKGSNGLIFHKLVVRDLAVLDSAAAKPVTFDLSASEKATDAYLSDFEKTYERIPNFKFVERHATIDRKALRVVFFAQDKASKKVLNAVVAEVK